MFPSTTPDLEPDMKSYPDMIDLVALRQAKREAQRIAKIQGAKTNLEYLMAAGVIITCDDERDNAYRWQMTTELAKEAGVPYHQMADALEFARTAEAIIDEWHRIVEDRETPEEHASRVRFVALATPGRRPGAKKPCQHNSTQRERGLFAMHLRNGAVQYRCCRCGVEFVIEKPSHPTAEAREAEALWNHFRREERS